MTLSDDTIRLFLSVIFGIFALNAILIYGLVHLFLHGPIFRRKSSEDDHRTLIHSVGR